MSRPTSEIKDILLKNKSAGFDELALLAGVDKQRVKDVWNDNKLGFKYIPRTLISIRRHLGNDYELQHDILVYIDPFTPIVIPKGFITDLGSVPKSLRWIVDKDEKEFLVPFVLHDVQYRAQFISRRVADAMLLMNSKRLNASFVKRFVVYYGVRIGGWIAWRKNKKEDNQRLFRMIDDATKDYVMWKDQSDFKV